MYKLIRDVEILRAIFYIIIGFFLYSVNDALVKYLGLDFSLSQIVFCSGLFALIPILCLSFFTDRFKSLKTKKLKFHFLRGMIVVISIYGGYWGFTQLPLANAYIFTFTSPFFIAIFSLILLKEKVEFSRWVAIIIGFCAVIYMLQPDKGDFAYPALGSLGAALGISLCVVIVRYIGKTENSIAIALYSNMMIALVAGAIGLMLGDLVMPPWELLLSLSLTGFLTGIGDIFMFAAYRRGSGSVLAPFQYTMLIWGLILGYFVFGEAVTLHLIIGGFVIVGSGLFIVMNETRREKKSRLSAQNAAEAIGSIERH